MVHGDDCALRALIYCHVLCTRLDIDFWPFHNIATSCDHWLAFAFYCRCNPHKLAERFSSDFGYNILCLYGERRGTKTNIVSFKMWAVTFWCICKIIETFSFLKPLLLRHIYRISDFSDSFSQDFEIKQTEFGFYLIFYWKNKLWLNFGWFPTRTIDYTFIINFVGFFQIVFFLRYFQ